MGIKPQEHIFTQETYQYEVFSDGDYHTYVAVVTNNHVSEESDTNVYCQGDNPSDHNEIVTKIEEQLTTMY